MLTKIHSPKISSIKTLLSFRNKFFSPKFQKKFALNVDLSCVLVYPDFNTKIRNSWKGMIQKVLNKPKGINEEIFF